MNDYKCVKELHSLFPNGSFHIPPREIDMSTLTFDDLHINKERRHNITEAEAKSFITNAKASRTVWKGSFERYYSVEGASYINIDGNEIRTAFKAQEFSEETKKIIEVLKKYGI